MKRLAIGFTFLAALFVTTSPAHAAPFALYSTGENVVVSPGPAGSGEPAVFELTSDTSAGHPGYGGMYWTAPSGFTLGDITTLSAFYQMITGTFFGGSPRFSIIEDNVVDKEAFVNWGTSGALADTHPGTWGSTGNLADSSSLDLRVNTNGNGFGSANINFPLVSWASFVSAAGASTPISYITIDVDGGWGAGGKQVIDVDDFRVNNDVFDAQAPSQVPEPTSMMLLATGAAIFGVKRYKQKRNAKTIA